MPDTEFGRLAKNAISQVKKGNQKESPDDISEDPATLITQPESIMLATNFVEQVDLACHRRPGPVLIPVISSGADSLDDFNSKYKRGSRERKRIDDKLFATLNWALNHGHMVGVDYNSDFHCCPV